MNRAVAFLKPLGQALVQPTFMKFFTIGPALTHRASVYTDSVKSDTASGSDDDDDSCRLSCANYQETWEAFKKDYDRQYATEEEERKRYSIFVKNVKFIEDHNLKYQNGESTYCMGINQFTDLIGDEIYFKDGYAVKRDPRFRFV